jgi:hypothetical protein
LCLSGFAVKKLLSRLELFSAFLAFQEKNRKDTTAQRSCDEGSGMPVIPTPLVLEMRWRL